MRDLDVAKFGIHARSTSTSTDLGLDIVPTIFPRTADDKELGSNRGRVDGDKSKHQNMTMQRVRWNQDLEGMPCHEEERGPNSDVTQDRRPLRGFQLPDNDSEIFPTYRVTALMHDPLVSLHIRWELPTIQFPL